MTNIKKLLLSSLMISSTIGLGCAQDESSLGDIQSMRGTFCVNGKAILDEYDLYAVGPVLNGNGGFDRNGEMWVYSTDKDKPALLMANKMVVFHDRDETSTSLSEKDSNSAGSTLMLECNANVGFNDGLGLVNSSIYVCNSVYKNGNNDLITQGQYDRDTEKYEGVFQPAGNIDDFPQIFVTGTLYLEGIVEIISRGNPMSFSSISMLDNAQGVSTIDASGLTAIRCSGADPIKINQTTHTYLKFIPDGAEVTDENKATYLDQLKALIGLKDNDDRNITHALTSLDKNILIQDVATGGGSGTVTLEHVTEGEKIFHNVTYSASGGTGSGIIAGDSDLAEHIKADGSTFFKLVAVQEGQGGQGGDVSNFMEEIEKTIASCNDQDNPCENIVPNSVTNSFISWPNLVLPLYPTAENVSKEYADFEQNNSFNFNMDIAHADIDLKLDCGTYVEGAKEGNTASYIKTLGFYGDNTAFETQVKLSGNQLTKIIFGANGSLVDMDLSGVKPTQKVAKTNKDGQYLDAEGKVTENPNEYVYDIEKSPIELVFDNEIASSEGPIHFKYMPTLAEGYELSFDTGLNNYISFEENNDTYKFKKFKFGNGATVIVNEGAKLEI